MDRRLKWVVDTRMALAPLMGLLLAVSFAVWGAGSAWASPAADGRVDGVRAGVSSSADAESTGAPLCMSAQVASRKTAQVSVGFASTAALLSDGTLWAWGSKFNKGMEVYGYQAVPAKLADKVTWILDAGDTLYYLREDRTLWRIHADSGHQRAASNGLDFGEPEKLMDDVVQFSSGDWACGAVKADGTLWTWGTNRNGMLGRADVGDDEVGMFAFDATPRQVMSNVRSVAMGSEQATAVKEDGSLWVLGYRTVSATSDGALENRYGPKKVLDSVVDARPLDDAPAYGYAVLTGDGDLTVYNEALGHTTGATEGSSDSSEDFGSVESHVVATGVRELLSAASYDKFAYITKGDALYTLGISRSDPAPSSASPTKVADDVASADVGIRHNGLAKTDGSLWMWGDNTWGELGDGTLESRDGQTCVFADGEWLAGGVSEDFWTSPRDLSKAQVEVEMLRGKTGTLAGKTKVTYTGSPIVFDDVLVRVNGKPLTKNRDYTYEYSDNVEVGKGKVVVTGRGAYFGTHVATFDIVKDGQAQEGSAGSSTPSATKSANPMKVEVSSKSLKAKNLKKKAIKVSAITVTKATGKVTYSNVSAKKSLKKFKIASNTGKISIPKNTKKGTFKVKVRVSAAGDATHKAKSKTVTVSIKVG